MSSTQDGPDSEREQTDESLRVEREIADRVLGEERAGVDELADAVISRARLRARRVLAAARAESDRRADPHAARAKPSLVIAGERALEDRALRAEHADADGLVSVERAEQSALLAVERSATDDDLSRERSRSDRALAIRDDFLGIVSHDLRDMLNAIVLSASLIEDDASGEHAGDIIKHAQRIRRGGARMSRLIGDLIDVASIEAGALAVVRESADVAEVVAEAVDTFQAQAEAHDISIHVDVVAPLAATTFDPARILQVLGNLLSNAIKFTEPGGSVTVRAERVGTGLGVCVSDTGAGIPADKLEVVFERFLKLQSGDRRGLGLGLYISKCIVQGHGGRIWVESEFGVGSKFCFTLPAA